MGAYFALWALAFIVLRRSERFEVSEALPALVILGVIFPALAMLATRRVSALHYVVRRPGIETAVLVMYLGGIAWVLVSGFGRVARIGTEPLHSLVLLGVKLMVFVAFPTAIAMAVGHYRIAELVPISLSWHALRPALWMSLAALLMQSLLGRGLHDIREAHVPVWVLAVATPLSFIWLTVEVGVVEEFFFRVLLQERLAAVLRSPWGGLVVAAVLACRSVPRRLVDANEEFRGAGHRARRWRPPAQPCALGKSISSDAIAVDSLVKLTDSLAMELPQPDAQEQRVKDRQCYEHGQHRKMRELRYERASQAFAGVHQRVHQDDSLEDGKVC